MVECWGGKWLPARVVQIVAEAPSLGKLSIAPPPQLLTPTEECRDRVFCY